MNQKTRVNFLVESKLKTEFEKEAQKSGLDLSNAMRLLMRDFNAGRIKVGAYPAHVGYVDDEEQKVIEGEMKKLSKADLMKVRSLDLEIE